MNQQGNPFIEAIFPYLEKLKRSRFIYYPEFCERERQLPKYIKIHCVKRLESLVEPMSFHSVIQNDVHELILKSYECRNPRSHSFVKMLCYEDVLKPSDFLITSGTTKTLIGISGTGKTRITEMILSKCPQVIIHKEYRGEILSCEQLVWLKLDCSHDGTLRGFCFSLIRSVDDLLNTDYYDMFCRTRIPLQRLISQAARIMWIHGVGTLVVDEMQHLLCSKDDQLLHFLADLVNILGISIMLIGTPEVDSLIKSNYKEHVSNIGDLVMERIPYADEWDNLLQHLFKYQWTPQNMILTPDISKIMYQYSLGIIGVVVNLYILSQQRAINLGLTSMTSSLFEKVIKDELKLIMPILNTMREKSALT